MYKVHVYLYICCSDGAWISGDVCGILEVVKDCGFFEPWWTCGVCGVGM